MTPLVQNDEAYGPKCVCGGLNCGQGCVHSLMPVFILQGDFC